MPRTFASILAGRAMQTGFAAPGLTRATFAGNGPPAAPGPMAQHYMSHYIQSGAGASASSSEDAREETTPPAPDEGLLMLVRQLEGSSTPADPDLSCNAGAWWQWSDAQPLPARDAQHKSAPVQRDALAFESDPVQRDALAFESDPVQQDALAFESDPVQQDALAFDPHGHDYRPVLEAPNDVAQSCVSSTLEDCILSSLDGDDYPGCLQGEFLQSDLLSTDNELREGAPSTYGLDEAGGVGAHNIFPEHVMHTPHPLSAFYSTGPSLM